MLNMTTENKIEHIMHIITEFFQPKVIAVSPIRSLARSDSFGFCLSLKVVMIRCFYEKAPCGNFYSPFLDPDYR